MLLIAANQKGLFRNTLSLLQCGKISDCKQKTMCIIYIISTFCIISICNVFCLMQIIILLKVYISIIITNLSVVLEKFHLHDKHICINIYYLYLKLYHTVKYPTARYLPLSSLSPALLMLSFFSKAVAFKIVLLSALGSLLIFFDSSVQQYYFEKPMILIETLIQ